LEQTESLEQLRALYLGARIAVIQTEDLGVGVDTPEDVPAVEAMLRQRVESEGQESKE
jgi:3-deoxy-manno-octulosonate cytidylyltransferase (CMP-KDO synthetase)